MKGLVDVVIGSLSGCSGKCVADLEDEVCLIPEAVGHALDDIDLSVVYLAEVPRTLGAVS